MKTTCVIIDDEMNACRLLGDLLMQIPDVEVANVFNDPQAARLSVMATHPDLVFINISMKGLAGLAYLDSLKNLNVYSEVVIVTSDDSYSLEAIRHEVFDYLLKPVNIEVLIGLICRFKKRQQRTLQPAESYYGKLRFNTVQGFFLIDVSDIVYVAAEGNYSKIYLKNGTSKLISKNIGQVEDRLNGFSFFRMDRSLIINLRCLADINRKVHTCTLAYNGSTINFPINRLRIKQLIALF
jgi:two-component system, LytTR family, response regulator